MKLISWNVNGIRACLYEINIMECKWNKSMLK